MQPSQARAAIATLVVASAVALLVPVVAQQTPPRPLGLPADAGTGAIAGRVFDASLGAPLPGTRLTLLGSPTVTRETVADVAGAFTFANLPPGTYYVRAARSGYLAIHYGQRQPGSGQGQPLTLGSGERLANVDIGLPRTGAITGRVMDEHGIPATGSMVRVYRRVVRNGSFGLEAAGSGTVDDRGVYRVFNLPPGRYVVAAMGHASSGAQDGARLVTAQANDPARPSNPFIAVVQSSEQPPAGRATVYFAGASSPDEASTIVLGLSEEREGVDLLMRTVPLASIIGELSGSGALPVMTMYLLKQSKVPEPERLTSQGSSGFGFREVPPGQYTILARASARRTVAADKSEWNELWWGRTDVTVSGQRLTNVVVMVQSGVTVSGRVTFVGAAPPPADAVRQTRVMLRPAGVFAALMDPVGGAASVLVDERGEFTVTGVMPGTYIVHVTPGPSLAAWTLTSAIAGGRDVFDDLLEVPEGRNTTGLLLTLGDAATEIAGRLTDPAGAPVAGYTIVAFPSDRRYWTTYSRRITEAPTSANGAYRLRRLPPGDYHLVALLDPEQDSWLDADVLRTLVGASVPIRVNAGEQRWQELRITR